MARNYISKAYIIQINVKFLKQNKETAKSFNLHYSDRKTTTSTCWQIAYWRKLDRNSRLLEWERESGNYNPNFHVFTRQLSPERQTIVKTVLLLLRCLFNDRKCTILFTVNEPNNQQHRKRLQWTRFYSLTYFQNLVHTTCAQVQAQGVTDE